MTESTKAPPEGTASAGAQASEDATEAADGSEDEVLTGYVGEQARLDSVAVSEPMGQTKKRSLFYDKLLRPIIESNDTPESIALGGAVGMFVALTPTVGIQMVLSLAIGSMINRFTRLKMNQLVGVAMCWVSNPITFIPMYYGHLWVGSLLLGRDTSALVSLDVLQRRITSYIAASSPSTWEYIKGLFLGGLGELVLPMWVGGLVISVLIAVPTYPLTLWIARRYQARKAASSTQTK